VDDLTIHSGPESSARGQTCRRRDVPDSIEQDQVRHNPKASSSIVMTAVNSPRHLSQGHFSRDNQKSLTGAKTGLPIYEAKMTGDTRLVVCEEFLAIQSSSLVVRFSIR